MKYRILIFLLALSFLPFQSCTDLEEEFRDTISAEENAATGLITASGLLDGAYQSLRLPYMDQSRFWAAQQHTSDETMGPTRGPDWDDNGIWRSLHNHTWDANHDFLASTFEELLQIVFATTEILDPLFGATAEEAAQARFLRAYVVYSVADGWGQVPFRPIGDNLLNPSEVLSSDEAMQLVIDECNEILQDLPDGPANVANKDAARGLLMRAYLNRGVYASRANPTFDDGDMARVIDLADEIINSGKYSVGSYFDNFAPNNDAISTENIWTGFNDGGVSSGNVRSRWFCTLHYNQNPSGWNGFTTLGDFYMSFEDGDIRKGTEYPGMTDVSGIRAGFLEGQQFDADGNELLDRKGNPLAFTKEVAIQESGDNLEVTGVRVIKYPIDYNSGDNADNDYVFIRFSDVWLMKAEAELRRGNVGTATDMVNTLRTARGASEISSITLDELLAERGRELYWEGHRRTDLLRFGKYLDAWEEKPASGEERLLFPIPARVLAVNPNLVQNPGY